MHACMHADARTSLTSRVHKLFSSVFGRSFYIGAKPFP
jgi:hypothetical protein